MPPILTPLLPPCGRGCDWATFTRTCSRMPPLAPAENMTLATAALLCASLANCVGFEQQTPSPTANVSVPTTLVNATAAHGGSCSLHLKHYSLRSDPLRPAFHFAPSEGHYMNDPNGPMHYNGVYHLFYQYNPSCDTPLCAREWGHAVSSDMVAWVELGIALNTTAFGACGGVWSGSASPNAPVGGLPPRPLLTYSVQCNSYLAQAEPLNSSDPYLRRWARPAHNGTLPVIRKPHGTGGFRDPSEPWQGKDSAWRILAACNGGACQWISHDAMLTWSFIGYAAGDGHGPTWEMPDLFSLGGAGGQALVVFKTGMENVSGRRRF